MVSLFELNGSEFHLIMIYPSCYAVKITNLSIGKINRNVEQLANCITKKGSLPTFKMLPIFPFSQFTFLLI